MAKWRDVSVAAEIHAVLDFWFGESNDLDDLEVINALSKRWFMGGATMDATIAKRFTSITEAALNDALGSWNMSVPGQLAHILVLDQFPRNLYRGTATAFSGDTQAMSLAKQLLSHPGVDLLHVHEQQFVAMPYQHSESLIDQQASLSVFASFKTKSPVGHESIFDNTLEHARKHHEIIEKFGRFPHRNKALGRPSTAAELEYLANDAPTFGQ